jgi:hypothetical protein
MSPADTQKRKQAITWLIRFLDRKVHICVGDLSSDSISYSRNAAVIYRALRRHCDEWEATYAADFKFRNGRRWIANKKAALAKRYPLNKTQKEKASLKAVEG